MPVALTLEWDATPYIMITTITGSFDPFNDDFQEGTVLVIDDPFFGFWKCQAAEKTRLFVHFSFRVWQGSGGVLDFYFSSIATRRPQDNWLREGLNGKIFRGVVSAKDPAEFERFVDRILP